MSAPSIPPDNSLAVEQSRQSAAERQAAADKAAAEQKQQELNALRTSAISGAKNTASSYLSSQGVNAPDYSKSIDDIINGIASGIAPSDPNPGSYFNDIGPTVYGNLQDAARAKASKDVNAIFYPNYAQTRLPFTLDDPYLATTLTEQQQQADDLIANMLARNVITDVGAASARKNIESQVPGVQGKLQDIGTGIITSGQQSLTDEANLAKKSASTLSLADSFDPSSYSNEADRLYNEFVNSLGSKIKAAVPAGLFDTSNLASIAGAGSFAQNTNFDPAALAGVFSSSTDQNKKKTTTTGEQASSIF